MLLVLSAGICGEAGILPEGNRAAYSVVTDTLVQVVALHKVLC